MEVGLAYRPHNIHHIVDQRFNGLEYHMIPFHHQNFEFFF